MGDMMTDYEKYVYNIWDRLGFHEGETGWVIVITPNYYDEPLGDNSPYGELLLTEEEVEELGLENIFEGYDMWNRETGDIDIDTLISQYKVSDDILEKLMTIIKTGPHKMDWAL
jgi:hypothetical protein